MPFCADQNDVINNFAVGLNAVIKRVECNSLTGEKWLSRLLVVPFFNGATS